MKTKNILTGLFTLFVISILGIGVSFAHIEYTANDNDKGSYYRVAGGCGGYSTRNSYNMYEMHNDMIDLLENGTYEDLENFRNEYNMLAMYWIQDQNNLENFRDDEFNVGYKADMGYRMMR